MQGCHTTLTRLEAASLNNKHNTPVGVGDTFMKPGIYTLNETVKHPSKGDYSVDRRQTRDWRVAPLWKGGTKFVVTTKRDLPTEALMKKNGLPVSEAGYLVTELYMDNGWSFQKVTLDGPGKEIFQALMPFLFLCGLEIENWIATTQVQDNSIREVMVRLVAAGKIQLEDVQAAYTAYMAEGE